MIAADGHHLFFAGGPQAIVNIFLMRHGKEGMRFFGRAKVEPHLLPDLVTSVF